MNDRLIFAADGFAAMWTPELRGELYLMLDDGWDVDYDVHPAEKIECFGSLELNRNRFPAFSGDNAERLLQANEAAKRAGWRGIGIWVASQPCDALCNAPYSEAVLTDYYTKRILDSKHAGVRYWKVDWGKYQCDPKFRKLLTDLGHALYPDLYIEHACCTIPVNGFPERNQIRYADNAEQMRLTDAICAFADVFRTYDVTDDKLSAASTIDRVCDVLRVAAGFVNCEDELFIGAALGCTLGIMRSSYGQSKYSFCHRLAEVAAAIRWQKIAPAFAGGVLQTSEQILTDECYFADGDTWYQPVIGKTVSQAAPAVVARNTALPQVTPDTNAPYILASLNPSGAYSLAAVKRHQCEHATVAPTVTCDIGKATQVGLFGEFDTVRLKRRGVRAVTVRCLYTGKETDITEQVRIDEDSVLLPGKYMATLSTPSDASQPAVLVTLDCRC